MVNNVIITSQEVPKMQIARDYPPYVTVLRIKDKYYAALMKWDDRQERYDLDWPSRFKHVTHTQAQIDAEAWAQKLGYEVRI